MNVAATSTTDTIDAAELRDGNYFMVLKAGGQEYYSASMQKQYDQLFPKS